MPSALLRWTGHPLVDVGIATLCAMAQVSSPDDLTLENLDQAAEEMACYYFNGSMGAYLTCVFPNAGYVNATMTKEKRDEYKQRILYAHRSKPDAKTSGKNCAFSGESATHLIDRAQLPLSTGAGILNFYPASSGGCYIAGPYLTALQALPLGGRRADGRLLIGHADVPEITLALARRYLEDNQRYLHLTSINEGDAIARSKPWANKYPDASAPRTLLLSDLSDILRTRKVAKGPTSVTGYWLTNSGQGPALDIFTIPSNFVRFLELVGNKNLTGQWNRMLARGWAGYESSNAGASGKRTTAKKAAAKKQSGGIGPGRSKNQVLEDLLAIFSDGFVYPEAAQRFVRVHLLGAAGNTEHIRSPQTWRLTELFLTEILGMNSEKISQIRLFADKLAKFIQDEHDGKKLLRAILFQADQPWKLRRALVNALTRHFRSNDTLLFDFNEYINVFEAEDAVRISDWSLIRDLLTIGIIEKLATSTKEQSHEALKEVVEEENEPDVAV